MSKKTYRINNNEVAVKATNAVYNGNISGVDNAQDAIDNLDGRLGEIEENGAGVTIPSYTGKKIVVIGDSFTQPNKWQSQMCTLLGATLISNGNASLGGVGGGRYGGADDTKWGYTSAQSVYTYCSNNSVSPDYILICLGTNDIANMRSSGSTLGSINVNATVSDIGNTLVIDNSHLTAGMQATILYLKDKFPNAEIIVGCTPAGAMHSGESLLDSYRQQFMNRLKDVCVLYGLRYLDNYYCCIDTKNVSEDAQFVSGGHPTDAAHIVIANYMAKLLTQV